MDSRLMHPAPVGGTLPTNTRSSSAAKWLAAPRSPLVPHGLSHREHAGINLARLPTSAKAASSCSRLRGHRVTSCSSTDKSIQPTPVQTDDQIINYRPDPFSAAVAFISGVLGSLLSLLRPPPAQDPRMPRLVQELGRAPVEAQGTSVYSLGPTPACTDASNLRVPRHFTVVTTASLPWLTGPAINPLLRSLYLAKRGHSVVLMLPWIARKDQARLFPNCETFETEAQQEDLIRRWCRDEAGMDPSSLSLEFCWYKASYIESVRSVFPDGDCTKNLGSNPRDVLILEEPEHLCWYHEGQRWPELFRHVIGVVHTNYQVYIQNMGYEGLMGTPAVRDSLFFTFSSLVCSAYCDVTVKLSGAGISLPNEVQCNIHGVRDLFFEIGSQSEKGATKGDSQLYFLSKAVYQKGWSALLDLAEKVKAEMQIDAFGSGPDFKSICDRAEKLSSKDGPRLRVFQAIDHAAKEIHAYKVLVNPSISEMLCTVTAEAFAMGKRVVLPDHPSNAFFKDNFGDRCHLFTAGDGPSFLKAVKEAEAADWPGPLPKEKAELLSWDAAIDRLVDTAEVRVLSGPFSRPSEVAIARLAYEVHNGLQKDTPAVASLLKQATLKAQTPWEERLARWRESEAAQRLNKEIDKVNELLKF